jgi:drug/metabolite transporter (DMT)-like permease
VKLSSKPNLSPAIGLVFAILCVSTSSIFIRYAQIEAPSLAIAAWRLTMVSLLLIPAAWIRNREELRKVNRRTWMLLALSGIFLCFHFASWITSLEYTSVASSVVMVNTSSLWVALLSPFFLHEKLSRVVWAGLTVALVGGTIVAGSDLCSISSSGITCQNISNLINVQGSWGNVLALIGAWCVAGYLIIGRSVRPHLTLLSYTSIVYGVAAVGLVILAFSTGTRMTGFQPMTYFWFAMLALIPQLLGHSTYNWALKYLSAAYISVAALGEPIASSLLAFLLLNEPPTSLEIVGGGLILMGIYLASTSKVAS